MTRPREQAERGSQATRVPSIYFLRFKDLPDRPNCAFYQRLLLLSSEYELSILVPRHTPVAPRLAELAQIHRCPWGDDGKRWASVEVILYSIWAFRALLRTHRSNIVYTFNTFEAVLGFMATLLGMRWVVDMLDLPEAVYQVGDGERLQLLKRFSFGLFIRFMRRVVRLADVVIGVGVGSEVGLGGRLLRDYAVPADHLICVPNGVDARLLQMESGRPVDGTFRLFYVGSVASARGAKEMLQAFRLIRLQVPEAELVVAGPVHRDFRTELDDIVSSYNRCRRSVVLLGEIRHDEVLEWILRSDVCLYPFPPGPGLDEVIPIKVLEYLALGRPVVASDLPGVRLLVKHEVNGLLFRPGDPSAMAEATVRLHRQGELRRRLAGASRLTVKDLTWDKIHRCLGESLRRKLLATDISSGAVFPDGPT